MLLHLQKLTDLKINKNKIKTEDGSYTFSTVGIMNAEQHPVSALPHWQQYCWGMRLLTSGASTLCAPRVHLNRIKSSPAGCIVCHGRN